MGDVLIRVVEKPARKVIIKRGIHATDYMDYCREVGCDVWDILLSMPSLGGEPVCLWLPAQYRKAGTSEYVQGAERTMEDCSHVPKGFDVIALPAATYLQFQGKPFREEDYYQAILEVQMFMERYQPSVLGYAWDDANPRIQLEPIGTRGYIELRAVKKLCL